MVARVDCSPQPARIGARSEEHTSELQSQSNLVCRLLLEKKNKTDDRLVSMIHLYSRYKKTRSESVGMGRALEQKHRGITLLLRQALLLEHQTKHGALHIR